MCFQTRAFCGPKEVLERQILPVPGDKEENQNDQDHKQQEAAYDSPNDDVFRLVAALLAGSNIH
jgi:hypothetical protein